MRSMTSLMRESIRALSFAVDMVRGPLGFLPFFRGNVQFVDWVIPVGTKGSGVSLPYVCVCCVSRASYIKIV
jgi:hypothetical protein